MIPVGTREASVALSWGNAQGAAEYEYLVRFGGMNESGALTTNGRTQQTSLNFRQGAINYGIQFLWKVRAISANGETSAWSEIRSFFFSYPARAVVQCANEACPNRFAWYQITSDIFDIGIIGVPPMLIADWISEPCINGRRATPVPFEEMSGYSRSARMNGCPP